MKPLCSICVLTGIAACSWGCSGSDSVSPVSGGAGSVGGNSSAGAVGNPGTGVGGKAGGGSNATGGAATAGSSNAAGGAVGTGGKATGGSKATGGNRATGGGNATGGTSAGGGSGDAYAASRQLCIDTINSFRATLGLTALAPWPAINTCVDGQSTADETAATAHSAFGNCGESAQDECLGSNNTSRLVSCLTSMWNEKNNAACTGCDACSGAPWRTCANCDYNTCGHYVNMSAKYYTQVSCGFSNLGGWSTQDFK